MKQPGCPPKGAKWDVDFAEFPNIVQLAWAVNEKERSFIIKPEGWEIPEASIEVHGITAERANAEGVPFADIIDEFLEDCKKARLLVGHNIYFDTSIVKAMILRIMGREYYDAKAEDALFKGKRIDTMMKTIIELKPKEYPAEQLKFNPEPEPAKTKKVKREVLVHDPKPIFAPDAEPENKVAKLLNETDF